MSIQKLIQLYQELSPLEQEKVLLLLQKKNSATSQVSDSAEGEYSSAPSEEKASGPDSADVLLNQLKSLSIQLDFPRQIELIEWLINLLKAPAVKKESSLSDLKGLGAEIWEGMDINQYIEKLRGEW